MNTMLQISTSNFITSLIFMFCIGAAVISFAWLHFNQKEVNPSPEQVDEACTEFRSDFTRLSEDEKNFIRYDARRWIHSWERAFDKDYE